VKHNGVLYHLLTSNMHKNIPYVVTALTPQNILVVYLQLQTVAASFILKLKRHVV
jgi:hypothetical protein